MLDGLNGNQGPVNPSKPAQDPSLKLPRFKGLETCRNGKNPVVASSLAILPAIRSLEVWGPDDEHLPKTNARQTNLSDRDIPNDRHTNDRHIPNDTTQQNPYATSPESPRTRMRRVLRVVGPLYM